MLSLDVGVPEQVKPLRDGFTRCCYSWRMSPESLEWILITHVRVHQIIKAYYRGEQTKSGVDAPKAFLGSTKRTIMSGVWRSTIGCRQRQGTAEQTGLTAKKMLLRNP